MWEREYEEMLVQYGADKIEIPEERMAQIMAQLDEVAETGEMVDRVAAILQRLAKSGRYTHIAYDQHAKVYVFIKRDGSREARSPAQLDRLFHVPSARPQRPAFSPAR